VSGEDRVVNLLASLPESYNMLVTALEDNSDVPDMDVVTERLLHEERKMKEREYSSTSREKVMTANQPKRKGLKCYHCGKLGHIKRNCRILQAAERKSKERKDMKQKANKAEVRQREDSSGSESDALVVGQALSASATNNWIVDSGATCHMCNNDKLFVNIHSLQQPLEIMLGDGHALEATGQGVVTLEMKLPNGKTRRCKLHDVLFVPKLSYNLLSVSKAAEAGKMAEFNKAGCQILNANKKLIAATTRVGSLYCLDCQSKPLLEGSMQLR